MSFMLHNINLIFLKPLFYQLKKDFFNLRQN
jgi:hypothetical protein